VVGWICQTVFPQGVVTTFYVVRDRAGRLDQSSLGVQVTDAYSIVAANYVKLPFAFDSTRFVASSRRAINATALARFAKGGS
jgi:hypothetical protein